jgi:hypothetical protein
MKHKDLSLFADDSKPPDVDGMNLMPVSNRRQQGRANPDLQGHITLKARDGNTKSFQFNAGK